MSRNNLIGAAFGSVIVGALVWFILEGGAGVARDDAAPTVVSAPEAEEASEPDNAGAAPAPEAAEALATDAGGAPEEPVEEAPVAIAEEAAPSEPAEEETEEPLASKAPEAAAEQTEEEASAAGAESEPDPEPIDKAGQEAEPAKGDDAGAPPQEPVFDVVRIEPDGSGLVAGRAAPGSTVEVVIEGEVVAEVVAGPDGAFVAFIQVDRKTVTEPGSASTEADQPAGTGAGAPAATEPEIVSADAEKAPESVKDAAGQAEREQGEEGGDASTADAAEAGTASAPVSQLAEAGRATAEPDGRPAEMQAASGLNAAAQSIILRARPGETLPVVESAPVFVVGGASPEEAPLIVQPEESGLRIVQPPSRPASEDVTLDTISYDAEGRVVFAGRARPEGAVRLYLNAASIAEAPVADDGSWRTRAAETIASGVYTLRLDQVDAAGEVTSRIETPFLREAITEGPVGDNTITVQSGDNLWRISESYYGEGVRYTVIYGANKGQIRDPDLIYPGQIFTVPDEPRSE